MRTVVRLGLLAWVVAVVAGCDWDHHHHHHDEDVVLESEELAPLQGGCIVRGTVRNENDHTVRVFITWRALDRHDDVIGFAEVDIRDVPRHDSRHYESTRFEDFGHDRPSCSEIVRLRHSVAVTRD
jgi:hypothetical protein